MGRERKIVAGKSGQVRYSKQVCSITCAQAGLWTAGLWTML